MTYFDFDVKESMMIYFGNVFYGIMIITIHVSLVCFVSFDKFVVDRDKHVVNQMSNIWSTSSLLRIILTKIYLKENIVSRHLDILYPERE